MRYLLTLCLLCGCGGVETRKDCEVGIYAHPSKPRPAGRILVRCDGLERATIDADKVTP